MKPLRALHFASPATFYPLAGRLQPLFALLALPLAAAGLYIGFFVAPTDAQQGEGYRIIFVHVPASWMAMFIYCVMAFWAAVGLAFNIRLAAMIASALAPTGAMFAVLSLLAGALWRKPMCGAWWVWDARLTSMLILFFLYLGFMALQAAVEDPRRTDKAGAILALVGVVNVPIIHFTVRRWNRLHQGASISITKSPSMAHTMPWAMLLMALASGCTRSPSRWRGCAISSSSAKLKPNGCHKQWHSVGEFFAMGSYAPYVWGSACALAMGVERWLLRRQHRQTVRALRRQRHAGPAALVGSTVVVMRRRVA